MPITPFLRDHVFDPEEIGIMGAALRDACFALGLTDRTDPLTEIVASRIIELAKRGVRTKPELYQAAMKGLRLTSELARVTFPADRDRLLTRRAS